MTNDLYLTTSDGSFRTWTPQTLDARRACLWYGVKIPETEAQKLGLNPNSENLPLNKIYNLKDGSWYTLLAPVTDGFTIFPAGTVKLEITQKVSLDYKGTPTPETVQKLKHAELIQVLEE